MAHSCEVLWTDGDMLSWSGELLTREGDKGGEGGLGWASNWHAQARQKTS